MSSAAYPALRLRRTRTHAWSRALVAETVLTPADLIWPLFVTEGQGVEEPIATLPGVSRWSIDRVGEQARAARELGIPCIALFPNTPPGLRTENAGEALNPDNLICRAVRAAKEAAPEVGVLTDVALDPYTAHGHDGLTDPSGYVLNDATVKVLVEQALVQAAAGADIVAPSDMMDGRVGAIRQALDARGFEHTAIMSYAAKYCSAFYGPFRDAAGSTPQFGDRKTHQMDPANADEALREAEQDIAEGADIIMVKPAMPYLDVIARVKEAFGYPTAAYQVSGEYAMLKAAVRNGWLDEPRAMLESLTAIRRAGADVIITYYARDAARAIG